MRVAIHPDDYTNPKTGKPDASSPRWADLLEKAGHEVKWVNVYRADILEQLKGCDGFMWRWAHFGGMGQIARRLLPVIENELGLEVYPDQATCWHYDDKIAQYYLLTAAGIPMPKTWVWFERGQVLEWIRTATFPLVLKLWAGAGSTNVRLVRDVRKAEEWIERLFGQGVYSLASASRAPWGWKRRIRSAAKSLLLGQPLNEERSQWQLHKNYVLFQEFIPDNEFDTRVIVIGNRAWACRRFNREKDFRASGSGLVDQTPGKISKDILRFSFDVSRRLRTQSVALDILLKDGAPVLCEISYTFPRYKPWNQFPGYWFSDLTWVNEPMLTEDAQVEDFLVRLEARKKNLRGIKIAHSISNP